jgi:hypothetical protein
VPGPLRSGFGTTSSLTTIQRLQSVYVLLKYVGAHRRRISVGGKEKEVKALLPRPFVQRLPRSIQVSQLLTCALMTVSSPRSLLPGVVPIKHRPLWGLALLSRATNPRDRNSHDAGRTNYRYSTANRRARSQDSGHRPFGRVNWSGNRCAPDRILTLGRKLKGRILRGCCPIGPKEHKDFLLETRRRTGALSGENRRWERVKEGAKPTE